MTIRHRLDAGWSIEKALREAPSQPGLSCAEQYLRIAERLSAIEEKLNEIFDRLDS